jgi:hypothetical protein
LHAHYLPASCFSFRLLIIAACALAPACIGVSHKEAAPAPAADHASSERDLATARDKLAIARLQADLAEKRAETTRIRKTTELELARAELAQFDENDAPNRLAKSKLDLARHHDALTEQREELAQLAMMYEKEDLADKTREIVLQRGKRRVERAEADLAISERDTSSLEAKSLPRERAKLVLEIDAKTRELDEMKREAEATLLDKRMAVRSAEADAHTAELKAKLNAGGAASKP